MKASMPEQARPAESRPRPDKIAAPIRSRTLPVLSVWLRDLMISLAISAFIIVFLYQPVKAEGTSMMPSLDDQGEDLRQQNTSTGWNRFNGETLWYSAIHAILQKVLSSG